ncbi:hypothetical protein Sango_2889900 [Sesamum angolense]|uniref:Reverse transcriptase domain-containing protein n=1 Tax=Sesamum angolense TaxID=2727404 RepID=A0AAE1T5J5_9LAMI|nr:hypothetical protein Sango_2889900 [Sesamum angolense]
MPGNRIWIAWNDDLLDVDVLNLDVQFIHCRINIRCAHLSVLATVVYGANDSVSRRGLWQSLVTLADSISDEPWIVGGDFNTVVDMSEGELFSWHNCSEGDRSLWKRLDRLLVNDAWLRLWPNSHYQCLNARTSDHSPLVLRGDTDNHTNEGTSMYAVTRKLRALKPVFRTLRKKKGDLSVNVKLAAEFLATVQQLLEIDRHNTLLLCLRRGESGASSIGYTGEIKDAFFDIAEDKAPGPDGYSSGFYKAAWPVIGEEIIKAILEFFTTGRLLKQVNTTILALIPKRLRLVLDKLISPSQNAFVPGRSIGDNILLAQELFAGYNRQGLPMRCALKVDLRKAYDTVEWDFLSAVLQMFGFPGTFIGWVEECVTTPMFSVCINGNPHGFFKGSRGLRQGDPMSPFLFVLIMEVLQLI